MKAAEYTKFKVTLWKEEGRDKHNDIFKRIKGIYNIYDLPKTLWSAKLSHFEKKIKNMISTVHLAC